MQKLPTEIRRYSQPFDAANWIAKKYRLPPATASLIAELSGLSRRRDNSNSKSEFEVRS
jgi:hypothetical protein